MDKQLITIIIIAVITIVSLLIVARQMKDGFGPYNLKVYGITLIIGLTGILALSEISPEKTTVCFGILGTIAGYLFGLRKEKE